MFLLKRSLQTNCVEHQIKFDLIKQYIYEQFISKYVSLMFLFAHHHLVANVSVPPVHDFYFMSKVKWAILSQHVQPLEDYPPIPPKSTPS